MTVFPIEDVERLLAELHDLRKALAAERAARQQAEQTVAEQRRELKLRGDEMRTFTVLRDNFHDLYREEHDIRVAAEAVARDAMAERDRLGAEVVRLSGENNRLRTALSRAQLPVPSRELRGAPQVDWRPRVIDPSTL